MSTGNPAMRELNLRLVRRTLKQLGEATRPQLAAATGLSAVTVDAVLRQLLADDEVREGSLVSSQGGRPSRLYRFHAGKAHVLGVFTHERGGRDTVFLRVADLYGAVVDGDEVALDEVTVTSLTTPVAALLQRHPSVRALGFGLPGATADGVITASDYPALRGSALSEHLGRYGLPVVFENDVNAAAVGYGRRHLAGEARTVVYLYFPQKYPPGSGLLIDGKLHRGATGWAGEVSFLPALPNASDAVARVVVSVVSVLNPHEVILFGEALDEFALEAIATACRQKLPAPLIPRLALSREFTADVEAGILSLTLDLLKESPWPPSSSL